MTAVRWAAVSSAQPSAISAGPAVSQNEMAKTFHPGMTDDAGGDPSFTHLSLEKSQEVRKAPRLKLPETYE